MCDSWDTQNGPDVDGATREIIVFHLVPLVAEASEITEQSGVVVSLDEQRRQAFDASNTNALPRKQVVQNAYFEVMLSNDTYYLARTANANRVDSKPHSIAGMVLRISSLIIRGESWTKDLIIRDGLAPSVQIVTEKFIKEETETKKIRYSSSI